MSSPPEIVKVVQRLDPVMAEQEEDGHERPREPSPVPESGQPLPEISPSALPGHDPVVDDLGPLRDVAPVVSLAHELEVGKYVNYRIRDS